MVFSIFLLFSGIPCSAFLWFPNLCRNTQYSNFISVLMYLFQLYHKPHIQNIGTRASVEEALKLSSNYRQIDLQMN